MTCRIRARSPFFKETLNQSSAADAKLTDKLNLEDMVFDYAGEFVDRMMEESEQIRNAITEPLA